LTNNAKDTKAEAFVVFLTGSENMSFVVFLTGSENMSDWKMNVLQQAHSTKRNNSH